MIIKVYMSLWVMTNVLAKLNNSNWRLAKLIIANWLDYCIPSLSQLHSLTVSTSSYPCLWWCFDCPAPLPMHILTPKPNGSDPKTLTVSLFFRLHRSGLNCSGSGKFSGSVPATLIGIITHVCNVIINFDGEIHLKWSMNTSQSYKESTLCDLLQRGPCILIKQHPHPIIWSCLGPRDIICCIK